MQYNKKTWSNRETEYPNQYRMVSASGNVSNVSIVPESGVVTAEGEKFDADTMNDLEGRIDSGFNAVNVELSTQESTLRDVVSTETTRAMGEEGLINNAIAQLNADLADEVARATGAEDALSTDMSGFTSRITTAESDIASLENRMTNAESDISTVSSRVAGLETSISLETDRAERAETTLQSAIDTVSSAVDGETVRALAAEAALQNDINTKIAGAYRPSGSLYFADLPSLDVSNWGKVYYVLDAFTTTADFIDGAGIDYPAGTYVSIIYNDDPTVLAYMYDAMTGIIDTSMFVQKTDYATTTTAGIVIPDGTTITIDNDGIIHGTGSQITVDQTVTQGSTNAVSGGAVFTYVDTMITQALNASY